MLGKPYIWVNYNDLTATSLEIIVSKGNHPKMALFQVSEILWNIIIYIYISSFIIILLPSIDPKIWKITGTQKKMVT
jgi:hypothetical protein